MSTRRKPGEETGISRDTPARIRGLTVFADCPAKGLASGDRHWLPAIMHNVLYKSMLTLLGLDLVD